MFLPDDGDDFRRATSRSLDFVSGDESSCREYWMGRLQFVYDNLTLNAKTNKKELTSSV